MSQNQPPVSQGQVSPDGNYVWNGTEWVANTGGAPAPPGYAPQPPKKKHTLRNVLIVIGLLFVLGIGGCMALIGSAANEIDKSIKESEASDAEPGGPDNPLPITPGKAFEVRSFEYQPGWKVVNDGVGGKTIEGLRVENLRGEKDSALVEIKFMKGNEILGTVDCTSQPIPDGQTAGLSCAGTQGPVKGYDEITINDTF